MRGNNEKSYTKKFIKTEKFIFPVIKSSLPTQNRQEKKEIIKSEYEIGYSKIIIIKIVLHIRNRFLLHDKKLKWKKGKNSFLLFVWGVYSKLTEKGGVLNTIIKHLICFMEREHIEGAIF